MKVRMGKVLRLDYYSKKNEYNDIIKRLNIVANGKAKKILDRSTVDLSEVVLTDAQALNLCQLYFKMANSLDLSGAYRKLVKSELDLIYWGKDIIQEFPLYRNDREHLESLYREIENDFTLRKKLLELTLSIAY